MVLEANSSRPKVACSSSVSFAVMVGESNVGIATHIDGRFNDPYAAARRVEQLSILLNRTLPGYAVDLLPHGRFPEDR
jgi:hypothetical protein